MAFDQASGNQIWQAVGTSNLMPALSVVYDATVTGFVPQPKAGSIAGCLYIQPSGFFKNNLATAIPVAIGSVGTYFRQAKFIGKRTARNNNTGVAYVGPSTGDDTQFYEVPTGGIITIDAPAGGKYDLADWYLDVSVSGDGVGVIFA